MRRLLPSSLYTDMAAELVEWWPACYRDPFAVRLARPTHGLIPNSRNSLNFYLIGVWVSFRSK